MLLCVFSTTLNAQASTSIARGVGLSGAYSNMAMGADAPFYNPANLSYTTAYDLSINLIGVGFRTANSAFNLHQYHKYNGTFLDNAAKKDLLQSISTGHIGIASSAEAQLFSVQYRSWAFVFSFVGDGGGKISKELVDLALNGNELDRLYTCSPLLGQSSVALKLGFSKGQPLLQTDGTIKHLGIGLGLYYLNGLTYRDINASRLYSLTRFTDAEAEGRFVSDQADGAHGMTLDIGATLELSHCWRIGMGVQDLFSFLRWNQAVEQTQADFELYDEYMDTLFEEEGELDSLFVTSDTTVALSPFTQVLPKRLFFGVVHAYKSLSVALEYRHQFHQLDYLSFSRIAMGCEYHASHLFKIRAGIGYETQMKLDFSTGLGMVIGPVQWDSAIRFINGFTAKDMRGFAASTSFSLHY